MRLGIAVDSRRCMGCWCCFTACKDEHCGFASKLSAAQPMMGQRWIDVREWERGDSSRRVKSASVATLCAHCEDPSCLKAAKDGAVYKRDDGVVIIDPEKSKGQKAIVDACPIKVIFWNEELQIPQKCTMCAELLDDPEYLAYLGDPALRMPRCVEACPNKVLYYGDLDDPNSEIAKIVASQRNTQLEALKGKETRVKWLNVPTVFLAGTVYQPAELDEVLIGAKVTLKCDETGETWETESNHFGDWEVEWLPKNKKIDITIEAPGYKLAVYTATTDKDHYVDMTYMIPDKPSAPSSASYAEMRG